MSGTVYDIRMEYWSKSYERWITEELFSFPWFFNLVFLAIIYLLWIKLVDKRRLRELLLFGSLIAVASALIDIIAVTIGLWEYKVRLFPLSPAPFPFDYTVLPIMYIVIMQYTSSWRDFLLGSLLASGLFSFVLSPVYVLLGIKEYHNFKHFYLFMICFGFTTLIKLIYDWIVSIEQKSTVK